VRKGGEVVDVVAGPIASDAFTSLRRGAAVTLLERRASWGYGR
jgi:hypothetical protein